MQPAKGQSIARLVKTAAGVAIAQKMVAPAAYAGKTRRPSRLNREGLYLLYSYIFLFNHNLLGQSFIAILVSYYQHVYTGAQSGY